MSKRNSAAHSSYSRICFFSEKNGLHSLQRFDFLLKTRNKCVHFCFLCMRLTVKLHGIIFI